MNSSLQEYIRCIMNGNDAKITECSTDLMFFPLPYSSQITTTLELLPYKIVFNKKPQNQSIVFTANTSKNGQGHC